MNESQLARLAKPFPPKFVHTNPAGGGSYVKHSVVTEKLLAVVGPFDFELVQIVRGDVPGVAANPQGKSDRARNGVPGLDGCVVGTVCRLRAVVDGRTVIVEEAGDCEQPHNWPHDGARLKDAMSDALKRCAMRLGVTLHLWSQDEFTLYGQLQKRAEDAETPSQRDNGSLLDGNETCHGAPVSANENAGDAGRQAVPAGTGEPVANPRGVDGEGESAGSESSRMSSGDRADRVPASPAGSMTPALLPREREHKTGRRIKTEPGL